MGLFKLVGKAAVGVTKLAGKGIKMVGTEFVKEAKKEVKNISKDLTKTAEKKLYDVFDAKINNIKDKSKPKELATSKNKTNVQELIDNTMERQFCEKQTPTISYDEQIRMLKNLDELLKTGIITQKEFNIKKKEILGL